MNPGLVVKLRPSGPWRIGPDSGARNRVDVIYHSDSLYSAVTSAMSRMGLLAEWLDATARSRTPAVCFSSCYPFIDDIGFVVPPRTIWPPTSPAAMSARVRWKSARFIPLGLVESILSGKRLNDNQWSVDGASGCLVPTGKAGPFRTSVRWNAAVDRLSGASERFSTACIEFREGCGLWTVAGFRDDAARAQWQESVKAAFRLLADTGFGGERSRGWGRAETPEFVEGTLPGLIVEYQARAVPEPPPVEEPPTVSPVEGEGEAAIAAEPVAETAEPALDAPPVVEAATSAPPIEEPPSEEPPITEPPSEEEPAPVPPVEGEAATPAPPIEEPPSQEPPIAEPPADEEPAPLPPVEGEAATPAPPIEEPPSQEPPIAEPPSEEEPAPVPPVEGEAATPAPPIEEPPITEPPAEEEPVPVPPVEGEAATPALPIEEPPSEEPPIAEPPSEEEPAPAPPVEGEAPVAASEPAVPEVAEQPLPDGRGSDESEPPLMASVRAADLTEPMRVVPEGEAAPAEESSPSFARIDRLKPAPPEQAEVREPVAAVHLQAHWMLSLFTPAAGDAVDWGRGSYSVLARGGRIDSPAAGSGELKKQIQMVAEGSVLYADGVPLGAAADVAPDGFAHPVFRAGFALAIPLPEVH